MIKSLNNLQSAFSLVRIYVIMITVMCAVVSVGSVWWSLDFAERQREKVYVLDGGASLVMALQQDVNQNRPAEARAHVKLFHEYFFTISPDKNTIGVIAAGINCEIQTDSVVVNTAVYPFKALYYGKTAIVRSSNITYRNLETECELVSCARSDQNPHGFMIEKWRVIDNSDITVVKR